MRMRLVLVAFWLVFCGCKSPYPQPWFKGSTRRSLEKDMQRIDRQMTPSMFMPHNLNWPEDSAYIEEPPLWMRSDSI